MLRVHSEVYFHAVDREVPAGQQNVLIDGVHNGGSLDAWRDCLPEGSAVVGIDDVDCGVPGVLRCEWTRRSVHELLGAQWFNVISCRWDHCVPLWPYLTPGGKLIVEAPALSLVQSAVLSVWQGEDSWLPVEEMIRVTVYDGVLVVEKRNPKVMAYMRVAAGTDSPFVAPGTLLTDGTLMISQPEADRDEPA